MSTTQENSGSGASEPGPIWLGDARNTGFQDARRRYCDVIRELDMTTAELEARRSRPE